MAKFKVGDRVKILCGDYPGHAIGDIGSIVEYKVSSIRKTDLYLVVKEKTLISWWYNEYNIEFVTDGNIVFPAIYIYQSFHYPYI